MKKSVLVALAALAFGGATAMAQEVTYEPDCSQGLLLNKNKNNWFLTVQGGGNMMFGHHDIHAEIKNRIGFNGSLFVGKWVTPTFGFRFGASWVMPKGATTADSPYVKYSKDGLDKIAGTDYYAEKFMGLGPEFDVMVNLTNWWCGYKPNRVYNAVLHGGAGAYWTWGRNYGHHNPVKEHFGWHRSHETWLFANLGLQNNFRLCDAVDIFIDVQYEMFDLPSLTHDVSASLGFNFNFGKTEWNCPVTAVCPTWKYTDAEGDALVAKLNDAENKIANLQQQLDACLRRPTTENKVVDCEGLATVYYPINQYSLSSREKTILKSVAAVMQEKPNQKYVLTGYADNYTGTDEINAALRENRVNTVKNYLVNCGVNPAQLDVKVDNNNLTDLGVKAAPLDRAVTIRLAD